jgi:anti-sigma regulatory factor (Ser/Thr protein kinase)
MKDWAVLPMVEASQVGDARRTAVGMARLLGFGEVEREKAGLVVTEAATNLVRHARGGELLLHPLADGDVGGLEVLALDRGPGMANVAACLRDGFSSTGTSGTGLGAIARLSSCFDIHSAVGAGTAVLARLWARPLPRRPILDRLQVGAVSVPKANEEECGDAWAVHEQAERAALLVADGLGHGPAAARAAREAVRVFHEQAGRGPTEIIQAAHGPLRSTRGAAAAVAEIDLIRGHLRYAGVGNIAGTVLAAGKSQSLVSHNGTVGHEMRRVQEFTYPWPPDALLVLHSDGLTTQWRLDRYPGLVARHPSLIAGVLYRDYCRGRDDVTVVVARQEPGSQGAHATGPGETTPC